MFFGPHAHPLSGLVLALIAACMLATPYAACWSANRGALLWRTPLALLLCAFLPPFALICWGSPLAAAGILFPGAEFLGLVLWLCLSGALCTFPRAAAAVLCGAALLLNLAYSPPGAPQTWKGIDTAVAGYGLDSVDPIQEYRNAQALQQTAIASTARVLIFPEGAVYRWNDATDAFWSRTFAALRVQHKTVLLGAGVSAIGTVGYDNAVVVRGAESRPSFLQHIPVPIGMWHPFDNDGVPVRLFGPGTITLGRERAAVFICYEQLLPLPILTAALERPTLFVGIANDYWAKDTPIPRVQRAFLSTWARLFDVPMLTATNY
jgi:apolipoprotein N-acyltransferase